MKRSHVTLTVGLFAFYLLAAPAGCNTGSNPAAGTGASGEKTAPTAKRKIGVSLLTLENPFFKVIGDHVAAAGKERGYEVTVLSGDKKVDKQEEQVKNFIVQGVSAIVLSPCDSKAIVPVIRMANEAGIPVFTVDIPCNEPGVKIVTQIATDNYGGGREAGNAMIEALGEAGGQVAILHFKQAESCQLRVKGFREVIDAHNASIQGGAGGKAKIEIVSELESGGDTVQGSRAAEDSLQANPKLRGIFAINDPAALGARAALERAGKEDQVKIIGFDGQPEGKQAIKEGKIYADPIQFPDQMGIQIVEAIVRHSKGEELPPEILIPTKLYRRADAEKDPELK